MVTPDPAAPSHEEFYRAFSEVAGGGALSFARFMDLALYHPAAGYYRRPRTRVGLSGDADFHTATSLGTVFGELVVAAVARLAPAAVSEGWTFVEIGAEPGAGLLDGVAHPFSAVRVVRVGEPLEIEGPCVVVSNELFDAQPFHRLRGSGGRWRETGVVLEAGGLKEVELPEMTPAVRSVAGLLPETAPAEGYRLDLPLAARDLCGAIAAQPWTGLFLAFDYGKTWRELAEATPAGTARAYRRHRQSADLLAHPGEQDLTCHICWDWLEGALGRAGFDRPVLESQESFFLHHAEAAAAAIAAGAPPGPDSRRSRLMQLVHPALQGQRFQVLRARR